MPPTPTPFPPGEFNMPDLNFPSVWQFAPDAIQTWNAFGSATQVLQVIILAMIAGGLLFVLYKSLRRITSENGGDGG